MGGENDVRGFEIWGISPIAFVPSQAPVQVLNNDGSARMQRFVDSNGQEVLSPVTQNIPTYQFIFPGGDTQAVTNLEYRIPIFGPVILAAFFDAGLNKISRTNQLRLNPQRVTELNAAFPTAGFNAQAKIAPGTQSIRASTGLELQVMMPVVNAPFRLYWAYNPMRVQELIQPPVVADRSLFPNQATFLNAISQFGSPFPFVEKRTLFRFSIGRTF
jgi:outer membrane protein insertion porin family